MAKADVLTLVSNFGVNAVDANETTILYDEVVRELGLRGVLVGTEQINVIAGAATYKLLSDMKQILEIHGIGGRLSRETVNGLQAIFGANWRDMKSTPLAFTTIEEEDKVVRLVPEPTEADTMTVLRAEEPTDVPVWLELPVAMEVLSREYSRESDHQDIAFAALAHELSTLLFQFAGVM